MPTDIRSGLMRLHSELHALAENPDHLDRQRSRFLLEKPPRISHILSPDSNDAETEVWSKASFDPDDDSAHREMLQTQLKREYDASRPYHQFDSQTSQERARIIEGSDTRTVLVPLRTSYDSISHDRVKKQWMEQGIWNEEWGSQPGWLWMHEKSRNEQAPSKEEVELPPRSNLFGAPSEPGRTEFITDRRTDYDQIQERPAPSNSQEKRNVNASRPFYQFVYQISKERERLLGPTVHLPESADINTQAYENVKAAWIKRGIWKEEWGIMPGMLWKHELPMQKLDELLPQTKENKDGDVAADSETGLKLHGCQSFSGIYHAAPVTSQRNKTWDEQEGLQGRSIFAPYESNPAVQDESLSAVPLNATDTSTDKETPKVRSSKRKAMNIAPSDSAVPNQLPSPHAILQGQSPCQDNSQPDKGKTPVKSRVLKTKTKKDVAPSGKTTGKRKANSDETPSEPRRSKRQTTGKPIGRNAAAEAKVRSHGMVHHHETRQSSERRRSARLRK